jgi:hypothetical protein
VLGLAKNGPVVGGVADNLPAASGLTDPLGSVTGKFGGRSERRDAGLDVSALTSILSMLANLLDTVLGFTPTVPALSGATDKAWVNPAAVTVIPLGGLSVVRGGSLRARQSLNALGSVGSLGSIAKIATQAVKPIAAASQPAPQAAQPAVQAAQPAPQAAQPAVQAAQPAVEAAAPVLSAITPITDAVQLDLIKDLLQILSTIIGPDLGATGLPVVKRFDLVSPISRARVLAPRS